MISKTIFLTAIVALSVNGATGLALATPLNNLDLALRNEEAGSNDNTTVLDTSGQSTVDNGPGALGQIKIATSADAACNYPNNGNHREGSSCKFYQYSTSGPVLSGRCYFNPSHRLTCYA